jgi:hypothetical protein
MSENKPVLLSEKRVAERYDVTTRTLVRWDETPALRFPPPILINGRRYRDVSKLDAWDAAMARKARTAISKNAKLVAAKFEVRAE